MNQPIQNAAPQAAPQQNQMQGNPDPALQQLWLSRFSQLSDQEANLFGSMINAQTYPVLIKLFPEMGVIFDKAMSMQQQGAGAQQGVDQINTQPAMPQGGAGVSRGLVG